MSTFFLYFRIYVVYLCHFITVGLKKIFIFVLKDYVLVYYFCNFFSFQIKKTAFYANVAYKKQFVVNVFYSITSSSSLSIFKDIIYLIESIFTAKLPSLQSEIKYPSCPSNSPANTLTLQPFFRDSIL